MIRKHALTLAWILVAAMTAATLWRLSLLPDWSQVTIAREDGTPLGSRPSIWLFVCPAILAFAAFSHRRSMRRAQGKPEALQALRGFSSALLLTMAAVTVLMQGVILARSLGTALRYDTLARCFFVGLGLMMTLFANRLPKLPWVTSSAAGLEDADAQKLRRLSGISQVVTGLVTVLAGLLLQPLQLVGGLVFALSLGGVLGIMGYSRWLRRHPVAGAR